MNGVSQIVPDTNFLPLKACNWELTLACTLCCQHCGSRAGKARTQEMTLDECFGVADQLIALGCQELTLIGGEVFLFPGWERLSAHLVDHGVRVDIVTNGYKIGPTEIEQLKQAKVHNLGLSIDGLAKNHNLIRGKKDAFANLITTIDLLHQAKIQICAITSLLKANYRDIEPLYQFLLEHGVQTWQLQLISPMGNMSGRKDIALSIRQIRQLTTFIREKNLERKLVVVAADSIGYFDDNETSIRGNSSAICYWSGCKAGLSSLFIDSVGNVKGCGALYDPVFIEGNLRQRSLRAIWEDPKSFSYNRNFHPNLLTGKCQKCEVGDVCKGGCRSSNYFSTGSLYSNTFCSRRRS